MNEEAVVHSRLEHQLPIQRELIVFIDRQGEDHSDRYAKHRAQLEMVGVEGLQLKSTRYTQRCRN